MNFTYFTQLNFYHALQRFFADLNIPVNYLTEAPADAPDILTSTYNPNNPAFQKIQDVYLLGGVDDTAFHQSVVHLDAVQLKQRQYEGLLIFGVTLKRNGKLPTRTQMADITRAFNREFHYTPVVAVFQYDGLLSFASCERLPYQQTWREGEKTGKVSILKDVNLTCPHTSHLKILENLRIERLGKQAIASFEALYKHWQTVFSVALLNKRFYRELSNWYFWALSQVEFPDDAEKDKEVCNATNVIRLITRLIFVWFLKEKHLIPETLFDPVALRNYLKYDDYTGSTYYKAILQNLFFTTLNTEMQKDNPHSHRQFVHRQYGVQNFYRYSRFFHDPDQSLTLFKDIPFLNGGLFECLDKNMGTPDEVRIDCFSDRPVDEPCLKVPDDLFFSAEKEVDLSRVYGDAKRKRETVHGLISILNAYKFTIAENTPIEEEIALDPELLGKVFENLLASYNPETQTTARKQTGSFYTPREIVHYMVDESLIAYLTTHLTGSDVEPRLRHLLAYTDEPHQFRKAEVTALINALHNAKILDPACGSGAFPMGMLHKMVHILSKLDPENVRWRETHRQQALKETEQAFLLGNKEERDKRLLEINTVFEENASDYGRKLYLIEHGIYGVDIQPIAVQIAKLRFFISLIVDQQVNPAKKNLGLLPLPNLETKFVAANTLISIDKPQQMLLRNPVIDKKEAELRQVRQRHFDARPPKIKGKYRQEDDRLRHELAALLKKDGFPANTTERLAHWNPYDQNAKADFFDPEWMFGLQGGFDIVIGNPPYINIERIDLNLKQTLFETYETCKGRTDIYIAFIEGMMKKLQSFGNLIFIIPYAFTNQNYASLLRELLAKRYFVREIMDTSNYHVFDTANVKNIILSVINCTNQEKTKIKIVKEQSDFEHGIFQEYTINQKVFLELRENRFETKPIAHLFKLKEKLWQRSISFQKICFIAYGARLNHKMKNLGKAHYISQIQKHGYKPFTEGECIERYTFKQFGWLDYAPTEHYNAMFPELFENEKLIFIRVVKDRLRFAYDARHFYNSHTVINCVRYDLLKNTNFVSVKRALKEIDLKIAQNYNYKFLLGFLNSHLINWYFVHFLSDNLNFYPDDAKNLPIAIASPDEQQPFIELVDCILAAKQQNPAVDIHALETEIDRQVYALYSLTPEEIALVEES